MDDLNIFEKQLIIDALKFYKNNSDKGIYSILSSDEIKVINRLINIIDND